MTQNIPTHDPESAWPLTQTDAGYFPGPTPAPPANLMPFTAPVPAPHPMSPTPPRTIPNGMRIAYLAIILGVAIPLTAIAASYAGLLGIGVVWAGIVLVAAVAFGRTGR